MLLEPTFTWRERQQAESEGWGVFQSDSRGTEIEADQDFGLFVEDGVALDGAARRFVRRKACAGSPLHMRALAYHQRQKKVRRWCPFRYSAENVQRYLENLSS